VAEQPLIVIEDLAVSFPAGGGRRLQAVDGVNLSIFPRQTLAVVGESGSGKSVSAMSILQLIPTPPGNYDRGRILWRRGLKDASAAVKPRDGHPSALQEDDPSAFDDLLKFNDRQMRRVRGNQIAMIFQEPMTSLNPVYTIGEQILEAILLHQPVTRKGAVDIATRALDDVGIADPTSRLKEYPHQLSGGMRQRVMIAMALACQPALLLADEPTTALDVTIQAQILDLLRGLQNSKGMGIMLITHDLGVVAENADTVAVMYAGRVCEYGTVYDVFQRPLHPYTRGLLKSMPVLGKTRGRLPTVTDGATIPEDFPKGFTVAPHNPSPDQQVGADPQQKYGGAGSGLYEVEPGHWVLCTPTPDNSSATAKPPRLTFRRDAEPVQTASAE
jgi:oligopeptide/dipeptide ABC transporter ATP-binding protein